MSGCRSKTPPYFRSAFTQSMRLYVCNQASSHTPQHLMWYRHWLMTRISEAFNHTRINIVIDKSTWIYSERPKTQIHSRQLRLSGTTVSLSLETCDHTQTKGNAQEWTNKTTGEQHAEGHLRPMHQEAAVCVCQCLRVSGQHQRSTNRQQCRALC